MQIQLAFWSLLWGKVVLSMREVPSVVWRTVSVGSGGVKDGVVECPPGTCLSITVWLLVPLAIVAFLLFFLSEAGSCQVAPRKSSDVVLAFCRPTLHHKEPVIEQTLEALMFGVC